MKGPAEEEEGEAQEDGRIAHDERPVIARQEQGLHEFEVVRRRDQAADDADGQRLGVQVKQEARQDDRRQEADHQ